MPIDEDFLKQLGGRKGPRDVYGVSKQKKTVEKRLEVLEKYEQETEDWLKKLDDASLDIERFLRELREYSIEVYNAVVKALDEFYNKLSKKLKKPVTEIKSQPLPEEGKETIRQVLNGKLDRIHNERQELLKEKEKLAQKLAQANKELNLLYIVLAGILILFIALAFLYTIMFIHKEDTANLAVKTTTLHTETPIIALCEPPFVRIGSSCCVDENKNRICDIDEAATVTTIRQTTTLVIPKTTTSSLPKLSTSTIMLPKPQGDPTLLWTQSTREVISALAVGDYDGDGTKEVAASASSEGVVYCFSNNGKLEWKLEAPSYLFTVKTVDVTGDGRVELAVGGGQHLYIVNGSGETVWKHYTGNNPVRRIEGFDADGDGGSDLVYGTFKDECDDTYVSAVDENGSSLWNYGLGVYYPNVLKSARVSGGVDWILVGTVYRAKDTARKSCGPAYNAPASVLLLDSGRQLVWEYKTVGGATVIETADLNGDGKPEILVGTYPTLYALDLYGKMLWNYTTVNLVDSLAVGDLNGDGVPEVVVGSNDAYVLDANGRELAVAKTDSRVFTLRTADLNGDGKSEIIAGSNGVYVFNYKGEKLYQSDKVVAVGDLEVADLDDDGYHEIVVGAVKSVMVYFPGFLARPLTESTSTVEIVESTMTIACYKDSDCGTENVKYVCNLDDVYEVHEIPTCKDHGTPQAACTVKQRGLNPNEQQTLVLSCKHPKKCVPGEKRCA